MKKVLAALIVGLGVFGLTNIAEAGYRHHHHFGYYGYKAHYGCSCACCQSTKYFFGRKAYGNYCCTRFICGCR